MASKVLCVIPARKGSKRLPNKTMLPFKGRFLIDWTIAQARELFRKDQTIVNTDYELIGYEECIIHERPAKLCGDDITTEQVLRNMLLDYPDCELLVLLQLTNPNRQTATIKEAIARAYITKQNVRTENNGNPDGQVYVWWVKTPWDNWLSVEGHYFSPDIDTQLDFEVAEALH